MSATTASHDVPHADHAHEDHHKPSWIYRYVFSTDHKVIGVQYGLTSMCFLLFGFFLMMVMRWSIAYPGKVMPIFGALLGDRWAPGGIVSPELYNMFGAMHGTIMVFLGVVPLGFAAFGNYIMPLQIGAVDMAFPKLNAWSYWLYFIGGMLMMFSFFLPTGAAQVGWTNYSPLATTAQMDVKNIFMTGGSMWLMAMVFLISSSLLGSVNFITTILNLRCKGMTWMRMPFFCWAMLVTAFLLLLAFPPLEVAALMQLSDRVLGSSFFLPTGLVEGGKHLDIAGGGSPLLYQHLFWFLGHPEVYVLLLPSIAIVSDVIPCNIRRPLWGYKSMVYGVLVLGFLSFIVWAHHMYLTGMGSVVSTFFQITTVLISVPSVILLTCLMITLWGGSIRFNTAMLFAAAFLPMFGIGGLTGLPLAFSMIDLFLHDTYYVIGHFHYVVAPGSIFGLFAGIYHWYPKITGRHMSEFLGRLHFWPSLVLMNLLFAPMLYQGIAGFHRRWHDGGAAFEETTRGLLWLNEVTSFAAWALAIAQIPFILNLFLSIKGGKKAVSDNPWHATTLEWATPTPPGHGNFLTEPVVVRGPYEYSVPGAETDYSPQWVADGVKVEEKLTHADH
ncbi:cytochrome C oxidase subunit I [Phragmitibacter flavus]|uniref:Cytochrome C oxidase subunit I n=1 Tax=Phragmitibacter flavus TaxID=2576071 RepID=A0A5R8KD35_9BACT|nr:cbb3-type cytochrome c oxidase subunit I [Phragmitibacter flavus]TLD70224.1 cytochrome C oxidase subunit I [Phragmitibacter flavus]